MQNEELRRTQIELNASRARYIDLHDLAPVVYCTVSEAGLIVRADLCAAGLRGVENGALIGPLWAQFVVTEDQDSYCLLRRQSLGKGAAHTGELRIARRDGETFWAQLTLNSAPQTEAAPALRIVLSDISKRKQAEEAVRKKEECFHLIAENIGDFIAVLDVDGKRIDNSPSYAQFLGADRDLRGSDSMRPRLSASDASAIRKRYARRIRK